MIGSLESKYGAPSYTHDKGRNKKSDFRHLIWDYSTSNSARAGDEKYELYQIHLECEMYTHGTNFAQMTIQAEVHSGKVMKDANNSVKIKKTFTPSL
jgi:hypothetical protein